MRAPVLTLFFAAFNQALQKRQTTLVISYSYEVVRLLMCLKTNNFIYGYSVNLTKRQIHIFLIFISNNPLVQHLFIYSSKRRVLEISLIELKKFQNRVISGLSPILILRTNKGYLTHLDAIAHKVGGRLAGKIIL